MAGNTGGYDYGIRQGLVNKGVANSDIGYNPKTGYVTVQGRDFMKGNRSYNGTNFTNQSNFNAAYDSFLKPQTQSDKVGQPVIQGISNTPSQTPNVVGKVTTGQVPGGPMANNPQFTQWQNQLPNQQQGSQSTQTVGYPAYNPYANTQQNPYTSNIDQVIQQLLNYGQNQGNFDPYASSQYKAAEAQAQRQAQQSARQAQEAYGSAGFGRSTGLGERVAGINNSANEYLMTQVLPQIEAQEAARRQQEYNNVMQALQPLLGQQGRADNLVQQDFSNNLALADLTGNYMPQGAQQVIQQLMGLKGSTEQNWMNMTPEQRAAAQAQGDVYRNQLMSMGVDISKLGADTNLANAQAAAQLGQRTLAGQAQDYSQMADTRNFNEDQRRYKRDFLYTAGRDKAADEQWQKTFDENVRQFGLEYALREAAQQLNEDQFADESAYKWAGLDADLAAAASEGEKYSGMSANDVVSNVRKNFEVDGTLPTDEATKDQIYMQIVGAGLPEADEEQALAAIGLTQDEIADRDSRLLSQEGK